MQPPKDMKEWAANWKEANEFERKLHAREPRLSIEEYLDQLFDLMGFCEEISGVDPFTYPDPIRDRENAEVQETWMKLRARWRP